MKELFVSYSIALILKEKGFDEPCFRYYDSEMIRQTGKVDWMSNNLFDEVTNSEHPDHDDFISNIITAPLYQQVIDWFRKKGIKIVESERFIYQNQWGIKKAGGKLRKFNTLNKTIKEALKLI